MSAEDFFAAQLYERILRCWNYEKKFGRDQKNLRFTLIDHDLVPKGAWIAAAPNWKERSLQLGEASTYTAKK